MSIFELEVKEKKRQAYLNKARTGAKGGSKSRKGMSTPYDYMNKKEKEKLNGEVEAFNMYTTILTMDEFKLKDEETQRNLLTKWREIYDNLYIRKELGISNKTFYDLVADLKIPRKTRVEGAPRGPRTSKPKQAKQKVASVTPKETPKQTLKEFLAEDFAKEKASLVELVEKIGVPEVPEKAEETPVLVSHGITFNYDRIADVETLNRILTKCQLNIDGEPSKFRLTLSLSEIIED